MNMFPNNYLKNLQTPKDFIDIIHDINVKNQVRKQVTVNATECTRLILPFAKNLNMLENEFRVCLKNEVEKGTHNLNSIVDISHDTFNILSFIQYQVLLRRDDYKNDRAVLEFAAQVSSLN